MPRLRGTLARLVLRRGPRVQRAAARLRSLASDVPVLLPPAERVLVVVAHPDDETLMCGGTIALLADRGAAVSVLALTAGEATLAGALVDDVADARLADLRAACRVLGVDDVRCAGLPDGGLDGVVDDVASAVDEAIREKQPDLVLTTWTGDRHADHVAAGRAVAGAHVPDGCECWYGELWTPLTPDVAVDVTDLADRKRAAVAAHATAGRALGLERALGLHAYRGFQLLGGRGDAECFARTPGPARD